MSLFNHTLQELHNKLHAKELSVQELVDQSFQVIAERDERIGAF